MQILNEPLQKDWKSNCKRPSLNNKELNSLITNIFSNVKKAGDSALLNYALQYDSVQLETLKVSEQEINEAVNNIATALKDAIKLSIQTVTKFHSSQKLEKKIIETSPGVECWQEERPIEKIGLYIPGGTAPLFSTIIMLAVPAKIAGCKQIVMCTPPDETGKINPAILYTALQTGVTDIYKVGGAQAIAAMSYGTESISKVYKIFGPGNQYVTAAKQLAQQKGVAIDLPAGPSELLVYADQSANPVFVASDLLSQAEHGPDSQVVCVVNNQDLILEIQGEISSQIENLPRKEVALKALQSSLFIVLKNHQLAIDFINEYAPEHLIICCKPEDFFLKNLTNAGSVFIGNNSSESAGDYASGTNHTLPTSGYAKSYSGLTLGTFTKKISFQKLSAQGIKNIGPSIELMAEAEGLMAHKNAISLRLKSLEND
jgi:histidinol dehydrogenase